MARNDGSLARRLDFSEEWPATVSGAGPMLRLAPAPRELRGPDKYKVLEHRRRQAQIRARRMLAGLGPSDGLGPQRSPEAPKA